MSAPEPPQDTSVPRILDDPINRIALAVFVAGGALTLAGDQFKIAVVFGAGIAAIGLAAGISGVESIMTRRATFVPYQLMGGKTTTYTGVSAILWGFLFVALAGLFGLAGLSIAFLPGGWDAVATRFLSGSTGWGVLVVVSGLVLIALGVIQVLSGSALADPDYGTRLMDWSTRLGGVIYLAFGLLLELAGAVMIFAPAAGLQVVNDLFALLLKRGG